MKMIRIYGYLRPVLIIAITLLLLYSVLLNYRYSTISHKHKPYAAIKHYSSNLGNEAQQHALIKQSSHSSYAFTQSTKNIIPTHVDHESQTISTYQTQSFSPVKHDTSPTDEANSRSSHHAISQAMTQKVVFHDLIHCHSG